MTWGYTTFGRGFLKVPRSAVDASGPIEDPAGYDPVAAGLKDQSLSIRAYARGPKTPFIIAAHRKCPVLLERWDAPEANFAIHVGASVWNRTNRSAIGPIALPRATDAVEYCQSQESNPTRFPEPKRSRCSSARRTPLQSRRLKSFLLGVLIDDACAHIVLDQAPDVIDIADEFRHAFHRQHARTWQFDIDRFPNPPRTARQH